MQAYREAAPPTLEVKLGPLRVGVRHLIRPVLVLIVALAIAGCTVSAAIRGPTPAVLRCSRAGDTVTCEEWSGDPLVLVHRFAGPSQSVHSLHIGGHSSKDCVAIENQIACGGQAQANVLRIQALSPGQRLDLDATDRTPMPLIVGGMFAFLFLALAAATFARTMARRSVFAIRLGPTSLEVVDKTGLTLHTLMRARGESARAVQMRAQRGEFPKWEIAYGVTEPFTAITAFEAGAIELEPIVAQLREALARVPPP